MSGSVQTLTAARGVLQTSQLLSLIAEPHANHVLLQFELVRDGRYLLAAVVGKFGEANG